MHFLSGFFEAHCPLEVIQKLNRHFSGENFKNHTFTIVYGVLDLKEMNFIYSSAGHLGPIRVKKDGSIEQFDSHGIPIGMMEDASYAREEIQLESGDRLFLISDGVYEAHNSKNEDLELAGVYRHLQKENLNEYPLEYTVNSLARTAYHWCSPKKPDDDISIVGLEIK